MRIFHLHCKTNEIKRDLLDNLVCTDSIHKMEIESDPGEEASSFVTWCRQHVAREQPACAIII